MLSFPRVIQVGKGEKLQLQRSNLPPGVVLTSLYYRIKASSQIVVGLKATVSCFAC